LAGLGWVLGEGFTRVAPLADEHHLCEVVDFRFEISDFKWGGLGAFLPGHKVPSGRRLAGTLDPPGDWGDFRFEI
jgi:hypothetical protein